MGWLMTILVLNRMAFMIIWEIFHERIFLNSVVLVFLVKFLSGLRLELIYISLIVSIRSSLPEFITSQKLGCQDFWRIVNSFLNKGKSAIPPLFNSPELFRKNFSKNSNLEKSGISSPVFFSRTNMKLHNFSITSKMVKSVTRYLDLSKGSGPNCIPVAM